MSIVVRFLRKPIGDTVVPTIAYTNPASGATISGTTSIQGTAGDNVALARVEVAIDGGAYQTASGLSPWAYTLDTTTLTNGPHVIHARAVDTSGNTSVVVDRNVTVNNVTGGTLQVAIISPLTGATLPPLALMRGTMSSTGAAVTKVELRVDSGNYKPCRITPGGKWDVSYNTHVLSVGSHTFTARVTDAVANTATVAVTVNVASTGIIPGIGVFKTSDVGYNAVSNKDSFSWVLAPEYTDGTVNATALDAVARPGRSTLWSWATNIIYGSLGGGALPYQTALDNNWIMHKPNGAIYDYGDGVSALTKVGDVNYQQATIDRFLNVILPRFPGIDGVFQDNIFNYLFQGPSIEYPDHNSYQAAMLSFVKAFGNAMRDNGYYYCGHILPFNTQLDPGGSTINDGTQWVSWIKQLAPYMNGFADEYYMRFASGHPVRTIGTNIDQYWTTYQTYTKECEALGCDHLPQMQNDTIVAADLTYAKASLMLDWDPSSGSAFTIAQPWGAYGSATDTWNTAYTFDVGLPLGSKTSPQAGCFRRDFAGTGAGACVVLVNANPTGSSFTVGSHTVAPGTGYIGLL